MRACRAALATDDLNAETERDARQALVRNLQNAGMHGEAVDEATVLAERLRDDALAHATLA